MIVINKYMGRNKRKRKVTEKVPLFSIEFSGISEMSHVKIFSH